MVQGLMMSILGPNLTFCFTLLSLRFITSLSFFHPFLLFISLKTAFNSFEIKKVFQPIFIYWLNVEQQNCSFGDLHFLNTVTYQHVSASNHLMLSYT